MIIIHFAQKNEWEEENKLNSYGSHCIEKNGFIPCYKPSDLSALNPNISTLKEYIILCIDEDKVNAEIKQENSSNQDLSMVNIYGTIPSDAVIKILPYTFNKDDKFTPSDELLDFNLINEICNKLNIKYLSHKYFNDGTSSRIILINNEYIIKHSDPNVLKAEYTFATFYKNVPMLQKVVYVSEDYNYIVYSFIPGDVMHTISDFNDLASSIKNIVSAYKPYNQNGFGYITSTTDSWTNFLRNEVINNSKYNPDSSRLLPIVEEAINELDKFPFEAKLIHGDFGAYNFIKRNERFIAAIDPMPMIGDPTYDLLFALVSNIDIIPFISINYLIDYTKEPKNKIIALLKVVLFLRICKCANYDKEDLESYLDFWDNLFN